MELSEFIRKARIDKGLTMKDVANAVGVSEAAVSKWESGHIQSIKSNKLIALAEVLDIPVLTLVKYNTGYKPMQNQNPKIDFIVEMLKNCSDEQLDKIIAMIKIIQ